MSYLLDTNVASELRRRVPDKRVVAWMSAQSPSLLHVSVLTFGEIGKGIALLRSSEPKRAEALRAWLNEMKVDFRERILAVDEQACDAWAELAARATLPIVDGLLMGTALSRGLTLVTRDVDHPRALGVPVLNPWET